MILLLKPHSIDLIRHYLGNTEIKHQNDIKLNKSRHFFFHLRLV